ncbi:AAA family ATPase [Feifania hominis]|uniref:AAA family ATPase n=1 Tax=Feifania hominis TaxID=2763660 RepID=A0A926DEI5_9FIRM|nr:AAA family ATPase [Feifania hominis]MBC8536366.1 AAA family ATPase [Feifania hominis]
MIEVQMLGTPSIRRDGEPVGFPYRKAEGLFYFLCVRKSITREEATGIFWAGSDEKTAKKNLRDAIYKIRRVLGEDVLLMGGNTTVRLNPQAKIVTDLDDLSGENILSRWKGDFLSYFFIKNCYEFESWVEDQRGVCRRLYKLALQDQLGRMADERRLEEISEYSSLLIKNDIYNEETYRHLMRIYARNGDYGSAVKLYYKLCSVLSTDLEEEPSAETTQLFRDILRLKGEQPESAAAAATPFEWFPGNYQIATHLGEFKKDRAASILLCGEVGIGKTTLLRAARHLAENEDLLTLFHTCTRAERELYLQSWYDMLSQLARAARQGGVSLSAEAERKLMNFFPTTAAGDLVTGGPSGRHRVKYAEDLITDLFSHELKNQKVVLLLDDIQWMDAIGRQLLSSLLSQLGPGRIILIASCREDWRPELGGFVVPLLERELLTEIAIPRLTEADMRRLAGDLCPDCDGQTLAKLSRRCGGNTLFFLELLGTLERGAEGEPTPRITNALKSVLLDLSEGEGQLLQMASLYPDEVSLADFKRLLPLPELEIFAVIERLLAKGILIESPAGRSVRYHFTHPLLRDYIHTQMSLGKRNVLHSSIAQDFEQSYHRSHSAELLPKIVYHYRQCGREAGVYQYRVDYLESVLTLYHELYPILEGPVERRAANREIVVDPEEIRQLHGEVTQLAQRDDDALPLAMKMSFVLGRSAVHACDSVAALEHLRCSMELAARLEDDVQQLKNYRQMVYHSLLTANQEVMRDYLGRAFSLLERREDMLERCWFMQMRGLYLLRERQYTDAENVLLDALDLHKKCNTKHSFYLTGVPGCYNILGLCYSACGDDLTALRYFDQAIRIGKKTVLVNALPCIYANAGQALYHARLFDEAETYYREAAALHEKTGVIYGRQRVEAHLALLLLRQGAAEQAVGHYHEALRIAELLRDNQMPALLDEIYQRLNESGKPQPV